MERQRRRVLVAIAGAAAGLAGCTSDEQSQTTAGSPSTPQGDRLQVNVTYDESDVEYIEANDTVRYGAGQRRTGTPTTAEAGVVEFERWAYREAASVGADRVRDRLEQRLSTGSGPGVSVGWEQVDGSPENYEIVVFLTTTEARIGAVVSTPTIGRDRVAAVTPRRIDVTLTLESRSFRAEYPVRIDAVTQVRG